MPGSSSLSNMNPVDKLPFSLSPSEECRLAGLQACLLWIQPSTLQGHLEQCSNSAKESTSQATSLQWSSGTSTIYFKTSHLCMLIDFHCCTMWRRDMQPSQIRTNFKHIPNLENSPQLQCQHESLTPNCFYCCDPDLKVTKLAMHEKLESYFALKF